MFFIHIILQHFTTICGIFPKDPQYFLAFLETVNQQMDANCVLNFGFQDICVGNTDRHTRWVFNVFNIIFNLIVVVISTIITIIITITITSSSSSSSSSPSSPSPSPSSLPSCSRKRNQDTFEASGCHQATFEFSGGLHSTRSGISGIGAG